MQSNAIDNSKRRAELWDLINEIQFRKDKFTSYAYSFSHNCAGPGNDLSAHFDATPLLDGNYVFFDPQYRAIPTLKLVEEFQSKARIGPDLSGDLVPDLYKSSQRPLGLRPSMHLVMELESFVDNRMDALDNDLLPLTPGRGYDQKLDFTKELRVGDTALNTLYDAAASLPANLSPSEQYDNIQKNVKVRAAFEQLAKVGGSTNVLTNGFDNLTKIEMKDREDDSLAMESMGFNQGMLPVQLCGGMLSGTSTSTTYYKGHLTNSTSGLPPSTYTMVNPSGSGARPVARPLRSAAPRTTK